MGKRGNNFEKNNMFTTVGMFIIVLYTMSTCGCSGKKKPVDFMYLFWRKFENMYKQRLCWHCGRCYYYDYYVEKNGFYLNNIAWLYFGVDFL